MHNKDKRPQYSRFKINKYLFGFIKNLGQDKKHLVEGQTKLIFLIHHVYLHIMKPFQSHYSRFEINKYNINFKIPKIKNLNGKEGN